MQSDELDQGLDLRLRSPQKDRLPVRAQPPREHREVEHQRHVCEDQLGQIDDYIGLSSDRSGQCLTSACLRGAVLVAATAQCWRLVIEIDDAPKPT